MLILKLYQVFHALQNSKKIRGKHSKIVIYLCSLASNIFRVKRYSLSHLKNPFFKTLLPLKYM